MFPPKTKTVGAMLKASLAQGNKILVCSMCSFAQKIKQEDLVEGIKKPARS